MLRPGDFTAEQSSAEFWTINIAPDQPGCRKCRSDVPTHPAITAGQIENRTWLRDRAGEQAINQAVKSGTTDIPIPVRPGIPHLIRWIDLPTDRVLLIG